jgi:hypothetical protein
MSQHFEISIKFMKNIYYALISQAILAFIFGLLILIFPVLLNILVSVLIIASGILALSWAFKIKKYTKIKIDL